MKYPVIVPGVGPIPCDYMIVGEAPGRAEIRLKMPFVGRSGELLADALEKAGSSYEQCYITNIFKGDVGEGNRNPTWEEIDNHFEVLKEEIHEVRPIYILTLGKIATEALRNIKTTMKDVVGKSQWISRTYDFEAVIIPCYHPAYI